MTSGSAPRRASTLRLMVVGAGVLALLVAAGAVVLACWGPHAVAVAVSADAQRRAVRQTKDGVHAAAAQTAIHVADLLRRAQAAGERLAAAARTEIADAQDPSPRELAPPMEALGPSGLVWTRPEADGTYAVPLDAKPAAGRTAKLHLLRKRLGPYLQASIDGEEGVVHAAVWIEGEGLIGAAPARVRRELGVRKLLPGFGPSAVAGSLPSGPRWLAPDTRLAAERVVSHVVPVFAGADEDRVVALVTVDVSCATIEATLRNHAARRNVAGAIVDASGELVASTSDLEGRLGAAHDHSAGELRFLVGNDSYRDAPTGGVEFDRPRAWVNAVGVPAISWSVVALGPPLAEVAALADGSAGVEEAARRQAYAFLGLALLFGAAVALGAFALADSMRRRLRPILDGAAAHARGDLSHMIEQEVDDELGELAVALNATATRLRQNLGRLQEGERRLQGLIDSMGEGFVIADVEDRITFVNQRLAEMLKRQPNSLVGRYVEELLVPDSIERYRSHTARRIEGRASQYEVRWSLYGARHPRTLVSGMPMYDGEGRFSGTFAVVTDVTDRTHAQEAEARAEKLRALGEMAGGVAHDFNNLLTVILGSAQFLLQEELPDEIASTLHAIESSALEGTERVRRLTEFTKARTLPSTAFDLDPNVVVRMAVDAARDRHAAAAKGRRVEYEVLVRCESRRVVRGHPDELTEALVNLIDNAFESMPDGGRLVVEAFDRGEDSVGLRIEDTGCGIEENVLGKIFDPFFTTKAVGRCSGLGLSIAYGIVRAHGGRIDVKSVPEHGSTFTVVVPGCVPENSGAPRSDTAAPAPPKPRVLLVGTDPREVEPMQRGLRDAGIYGATVASPQAALAILDDRRIFNTLVVEHDLGSSSGWNLARDARAHRVDLRIVLVTAPGRPVDETQARNAGIDRVLVRPFDARDLQATVFSVLVAPPARRIDPSARPRHAEEAAGAQGRISEVWGESEAREIIAMLQREIREASDSSG